MDITISVTDDEYSALEAVAEANACTVGELLRTVGVASVVEAYRAALGEARATADRPAN